MELAYAPPARSGKRPMGVLIGGLITTALALLGVFLLDKNSAINVMGWYLDYVLPGGALLVGIAAGSGYGIVSWITGVKIRRGLLLTILGLQIAAYFSAQYIEFKRLGDLYDRSTGQAINFPQYFHLTTINFSWKGKDGAPGEPLGMAGYFFKALEIAGFVAGGLIVPGVLFKKPYCELCQMYMRYRSLALFPASVPARKVKDPAAKAAYEQEQRDARQLADQAYDGVKQSALAGDAAAFRGWIATASGKSASKLPSRLSIALVHCRNCHSGYLKASLISGKGKQIKVVELDKAELPPASVQFALAMPG
jgi:hypothetical protein